MDMSSRLCKGQTLCSKLARSEMLCGLLDQLDSWVIRTVITPPKGRYNLMKEASLPPPDAQRAGMIQHNTVKSFFNTISSQQWKSSLSWALQRRKPLCKAWGADKPRRTYQQVQAQIGDFIKAPLSTWRSRLAFALTAIKSSPSIEISTFTSSELVIQALHYQLCLHINSNREFCPEYKHQQSCNSISAACLAKLNIHKWKPLRFIFLWTPQVKRIPKSSSHSSALFLETATHKCHRVVSFKDPFLKTFICTLWLYNVMTVPSEITDTTGLHKNKQTHACTNTAQARAGKVRNRNSPGLLCYLP